MQPALFVQDQDLLLARALQEQERAFHALWSSANASDAELDLIGDGTEDAKLAWQLQSEEQSLYHQMQQGGLNIEEELDYDHLGYEQLNAIEDAVGTVSKGLRSDVINKLPQMQVKQLQQLQQDTHCSRPPQQQHAKHQQLQQQALAALDKSGLCAVCQCDFAPDETVKLLPCNHLYHQECVDHWLQLNKMCPICNKEVTSSDQSDMQVDDSFEASERLGAC
eukprot:GHRR01034684.1.p1 GENE.GHRR01034684.1~~GHRR01034684.1.p1  ORF type:complete len:249 (+),score=78.95 GHRR01034684.1:83-748(+)